MICVIEHFSRVKHSRIKIIININIKKIKIFKYKI